MPLKAPYADTQMSAFLTNRILELRPRKSQVQIASEAGFVNANVLSMLKSGKTKLPLDRVPALAAALECDPSRLFRMAVEHKDPVLTLRARTTLRGIFGK